MLIPRPHSPFAARRRRISAVLAGGALAVTVVGACGSSTSIGTPTGGRPTVVVTYSILGDVVSRLVGDTAAVQVIIPDGLDPHDYSASARDIETMNHAALVVANGLGLEEGLTRSLERASADGVAVFTVADHVTVRALDGTTTAPTAGGHAPSGSDPHLWTDPQTMAQMLPDLAAALQTTLHVDLDANLAAVQSTLAALDAQVRTIVGRIPAGGCTLVTGHESLGYFAARYGCQIVGAVIPSLSSTAEASAQQLAQLAAQARAAGVKAIFTEVGTPAQVAEQVARTVGVPLVELPTHRLPTDGGYPAFIIALATGIADGLTGAA